MRRVLELPAYRRLLAAYALNEVAYSIGSLALALLVLRRTGSSLAAAAYFLCAQFVPALLSPALVGRIDTRPVRRTLPVLYGLEALAFALLAWLTGRFALAPVLAVALLDGVLALIARALARAAAVAVTAPADLLREGNALSNSVFSVCFVAGPAGAGAIVAAGGITPALLATTVVFVAVAATILTAADLPGAVEVPDADGARRLRALLARVRERPELRRLLTVQAAAVLFFAISVPVEVVLATRTLHAGAAGFGALGSCWGVGAVAGSAVFARLRAAPARALICGGAGTLAAGMAVMAAAPGLAVALAGAALAGIGNGIEGVAVRTAVQELTAAGWMAITMSLSDSIQQAVPGAGIALGGAITALSGPRTALAVAAVGAALVTAAAWPLLRPAAAGEAIA